VDETAVFIGGLQKKNFVRIVIEQIARVMPPERYPVWMDMVSTVCISILLRVALPPENAMLDGSPCPRAISRRSLGVANNVGIHADGCII
jgi:hypothetical protein